MATASKLVPRIILGRTRERYEKSILRNQFGFRKNKSTTDAIYVNRHLLEKTKGCVHIYLHFYHC